MTHADWNARIKRALELADRRPASAVQILRTLIRRVEDSCQTGLHEWHLAQTLHVLSLVQVRSGDHDGAGKTLLRLTDEHAMQLKYAVRAYVSACAATAIHLARNGDRTRAKRILRQAHRWSALLRPKDKLLDQAHKTMAALSARIRTRKSAADA